MRRHCKTAFGLVKFIKAEPPVIISDTVFVGSPPECHYDALAQLVTIRGMQQTHVVCKFMDEKWENA